MDKNRSKSAALLLGLALYLPMSSLGDAQPPQEYVFKAFTSHIHHQITSDKKLFVRASTCIEWFYKQERHKPERDVAGSTGVASMHLSGLRKHNIQEASPECRSHYPGGLEAARKDFGLTQSFLSLSLTFYQLALVGDGNDDRQYSSGELKDLLESFGLPFNTKLAQAVQLSTLTAKFDSIRKTVEFDALMTGMEILLERGYRLTSRDQDALNQVMG